MAPQLGSPGLRDMWTRESGKSKWDYHFGDIGCSSPVIGEFPPELTRYAGAGGVSLYFRREDEARRFAAALVSPPAWVGFVRDHYDPT